MPAAKRCSRLKFEGREYKGPFYEFGSTDKISVLVPSWLKRKNLFTNLDLLIKFVS